MMNLNDVEMDDLTPFKRPVCRWAVHPVIDDDKVIGHEVLLRLGFHKQYIPITEDQAKTLKAMHLDAYGAQCAAELAKNPVMPSDEKEILAAAENYEATVEQAMDDAERMLPPLIEDLMACEQQKIR